MNSAIASIEQKMSKISQLMDQQRQFNKKNIFDVIYKHSDNDSSHSSSELNFQNQCTIKSFDISEPIEGKHGDSMKQDKLLIHNTEHMNQSLEQSENQNRMKSPNHIKNAINKRLRNNRNNQEKENEQNQGYQKSIEHKRQFRQFSHFKKQSNSQVFACLQNYDQQKENGLVCKKLNQEDLKKVKQSSMIGGKSKINSTNRNKGKTSRKKKEIINAKSSAHLQGSGNQKKKTVQEKEEHFKKISVENYSDSDYFNESMAHKKNVGNQIASKEWIRSSEKYKKINRVNISKLQQSIKKNNTTTNLNAKLQYNESIRTNENQKLHFFKSKDNMLKNFSVPSKQQIMKVTPNENGSRSNKRNNHNNLGKMKKDVIFEGDKKTKITKPDHKNQNLAQNTKQVHHFIEKLNFDQKKTIMQRILETKNIFKSYTLATKKYIEVSKKINIKECRNIEKQIRSPTQQAIFKMKILIAFVTFFTQFLQPTEKTIIGRITKIVGSEKGDDEIKKQNQKKTQISLQNLIILLLENPKQLIELVHCLPNKLYNKNILSQVSIQTIINSYESINEKLDSELQYFLIKKSIAYEYFHELVEYILFLKAEDLISQTQRRNLNENRAVVEYHSSRSKRGHQKMKSSRKINNHCDSERKITVQDLETQRFYLNWANKEKKGKGKQKDCSKLGVAQQPSVPLF